jgi:hypothetical protein
MRLMTSLLLSVGLALSNAARADDALGLYIGAGVGQASMTQDNSQIDAHATSW